MIRLIPYVVYLIIIAMHQVLLNELVSVFDFTINVTALIVLLVSMYKSETTALWFACIAGVVASAGQPELMGWYCLSLSALALTATQVREHLDIDTLMAKLVVIFGGTLLFNIVLLIMEGWGSFFYFLFLQAIPGAIYTTIVGWIFLIIKGKYITRQTIEEAL